MHSFSNEDLQRYFDAGQMGFWKIEFEEGKRPRLYTDARMNGLLGTSADMTPQECYDFLICHIHPEEQMLFLKYIKEVKKGEAEIVYRYLHPILGDIYVRCTGRKIVSVLENTICIVGYHKREQDTMRLEANRSLENHLIERNRDLEKRQLKIDDYYKNLLDLVSCGVLSYTLPGYEILHMNAEALRIFGIQGLEEGQEYLGNILKNVSYVDGATRKNLITLREKDGCVDYEAIIFNHEGKAVNILAKSESFMTLKGEKSVVTTFLDISENVTLRNEKSILEVLSVDYTAVYLCDLISDTLATVKMDDSSYVSEISRRLKENKNCYSYRLQYYYERYVVKESAPDFMEKMQAERLIEFLSHNKRFIYRFRIKANRSGIEHFEVQAVRLKTKSGFKVVLGFRFIDDVLQEQEHQKEQLENALAQARLNEEIIGTIAKTYWSIYHLDLQNGIYQEISAKSGQYRFTGKIGEIAEVFENTSRSFIAEEFQERLNEFVDLSTLSDRLKDTDSISMEVRTAYNAWFLIRYIVKKRDEFGHVLSVLYVVLENNKEKIKELEYQEKLLHIAEEAKRANVAKTDFLRRMSHDIRTPINGIMGMLSIAEYYGNDIEKQKECRNKVRETTGFLLELVNNILDMNKLESGNMVLEHKSFDLIKTLREINTITQVNAQEHGISLVMLPSNIEHKNLIGSPLHLRQILQNLSGNAVKYNRQGGKIFLGCRELSHKNGKVVMQFICEDTGIGMSKEFQKHAFEPFSQERDQGRSTYTGTGLGLAITKQLIDLMGGSLSMQSEQGVGTKFMVTQSFEVNQEYEEISELEQSDLIDLRGYKILLVEDNEINMEITRFLLEKKGAEITESWNGKEAVDIFVNSKEGYFDLILMDIMMPIMNGLVATKVIRSLERKDAKTIPILAMTANAFQEDIQHSKESGMDEHLSKPLEEKELDRALRRYLPEISENNRKK